jgi:hypothetical protein
MILATINNYRELARCQLPHFLLEYIDGGSLSEKMDSGIRSGLDVVRALAGCQGCLIAIQGHTP